MFGRRIVNIQQIFNLISFPHLNIFNCTNDSLKMEKEISIHFISTLIVRCSTCLEENINQAVVLRTLGTGVRYTQVRQQFG